MLWFYIVRNDDMVEVGIIPESSASKFRYELRPGTTDKGSIKVQETNKANIEELLEQDLKRTFNYPFKDISSLLERNSFAVYDGNVAEFIDTLSSRSEIEFLMLNYIGKMPSKLISPYDNSDISTLAFFNRLNKTAEFISDITGKKTKVNVAIENMFFEKYVLSIEHSTAKATYEQTSALISDFGLNMIELRPMEEFLGNAFEAAFSSCIEEFSRNKEVVKNGEGFERLFRVFYFSYPTSTFADAVDVYSNRKDEIAEWALERSIRYAAFNKARADTDFWGRNKRYLRSTDSRRKNVMSFGFGVGRLSPPHGVGVVSGGGIGTEYYYDIITAIKDGKKEATEFYYKNLPFYTDITGIKLV